MDTQLLRLDFAAFKWDVRFAGMLLGMLIWSTAATTTTRATSASEATERPSSTDAAEVESHYPVSGFAGFGNGESYYASVDRILRNGETSFRSQDVRWRQVVSRDAMERRRLFKRATTERRRPSRKYLATTTTTMQTIASEPDEAPRIVKRNAIDTTNTISTLAPEPTTHRLGNPTNDKRLNLSCHHIERFDSSFVANITQLDLSCNRIATADQLRLNNLVDLETLDMSHNQLRRIGPQLFRNTTSLRTIDLSGNQLDAIERTDFVQMRNVETLRLAHNRIVHIARDTFSDLVNLQLLDLSHNAIDAAAVRALQGIPALVALSVAFNVNLGWALQEFVASWSLKELDASGTGLCAIPAALAQSVHTLNVSHNHFEIIRCGDLDSYPLLQYLDISHNSIADIEDDALGRLEILITVQLHNNRISSVPSSLPSSLVHLFLQNNQIADIQPNVFAQLENLETLDLSGNQLTYLPGLPLPRLLTLNLRASGLRGLSQSVVKTSPNLKDLLLEANPIKCTDLMGIAEWTTACRSEVPIDIPRIQPNISGSLLEPIAVPMCCAKPVVQLLVKDAGVRCKREPTRRPIEERTKPTKRSRKAKMEEIWMEISNSTIISATEATVIDTLVTEKVTEAPSETHPGMKLLAVKQLGAKDSFDDTNPTTMTPSTALESQGINTKIVSTQTPIALLNQTKDNPNHNNDNSKQQPRQSLPSPMFNKKKSLSNVSAAAAAAKRASDKKSNKFKALPKVGQSQISSKPPQPNNGKPSTSSHIYATHGADTTDTTTPSSNLNLDVATIAAPSAAPSALSHPNDGSPDLANNDSLSATIMMMTQPNHQERVHADNAPSPTTTGSPIAKSVTASGGRRILDVTRQKDNQRSITKQRRLVGVWNTNQDIESAPSSSSAAEPAEKHPSTRSNGDSHVGISQPVRRSGGGVRKWGDSSERNNDLTRGSGEHANDVINALDKHSTNGGGGADRMVLPTGSHDYISDAASADDHNKYRADIESKKNENDETNIYVAEQSLVAEMTMNDAPEHAKTQPTGNDGLGETAQSSDPIIKSDKGNGSAAVATTATTNEMDHVPGANVKPTVHLMTIPFSGASSSSPQSKTINEERLVVMSSLAHSESPAVIVHSNHRPIEHGHPNDHGVSEPDARTSTSGLPEQWNAVRTTTSHPGLFIVLGVTIGMCVTLALVQIYRCARPWPRGHLDPGSADDDDPDQYAPTHRDMLPMELLGAQRSSTIQYTEAPIELW